MVDGYSGVFQGFLKNCWNFTSCERVDFSSVHCHEVVGAVVHNGAFARGGDFFGFSSISRIDKVRVSDAEKQTKQALPQHSSNRRIVGMYTTRHLH